MKKKKEIQVSSLDEMTQNTEPDTLSSKQPVWTCFFFRYKLPVCQKNAQKHPHDTTAHAKYPRPPGSCKLYARYWRRV